jgi:hypothetical protein
MKKAALIVLLTSFFACGAVRALDFAPGIAPPPAPEIATNEADNLLAPPPPPASEFPVLKDNPGLFRWRCPAELNANYLLFSTVGGSLDLKFDDPWQFGRRLGLAEDALEYSLGLGLTLGFDDGGRSFFSFPLECGARLYLPEGSLWGADPFCGLALDLNLLGTGGQTGGTGLKLYGGLRQDRGQPLGRLDLAFGVGSQRVGDARAINTFFLTLGRPIVL